MTEARNLPKRSCSSPGCSQLTDDGSRCPDHRRARHAQINRDRAYSSAKDYGAAHREMRLRAFIRDDWRCCDCGWEPDVVRDFRQYELGDPPVEQILHELRDRHNRKERHLHADHEIPIQERPDLRLSMENLRTRCNACHSAKTLRELRGIR